MTMSTGQKFSDFHQTQKNILSSNLQAILKKKSNMFTKMKENRARLCIRALLTKMDRGADKDKWSGMRVLRAK